VAKNKIGYCTNKYHKKELTWAMIQEEGCLERKCDYFLWISLKSRDEWRRKNGDDKRDIRLRIGTLKERKERRRKINMEYLESNRIEWLWIDKKCDHILIAGYLDYFPGSTSWVDRTTGEHGYAMLYKLITKSSSH
jgi:hypothetical protein